MLVHNFNSVSAPLYLICVFVLVCISYIEHYIMQILWLELLKKVEFIRVIQCIS